MPVVDRTVHTKLVDLDRQLTDADVVPSKRTHVAVTAEKTHENCRALMGRP